MPIVLLKNHRRRHTSAEAVGRGRATPDVQGLSQPVTFSSTLQDMIFSRTLACHLHFVSYDTVEMIRGPDSRPGKQSIDLSEYITTPPGSLMAINGPCLQVEDSTAHTEIIAFTP